MSTFVAPQRAYTDEQLAFLKSVDSPTMANAIEPFKLRDRTDGYVGGNIGCLFPDLGVMVGLTNNVTLKVEWSILEEDIGNLYPIAATAGARPGPVDGADDPDNDQFVVHLQAKF